MYNKLDPAIFVVYLLLLFKMCQNVLSPKFRENLFLNMYIVQRPVCNETHDKNNISMVSVRDKPVSNQERHMGDMELSSSSSRILKELIFQSRGVENGGQLIELIFQSCR